MATYKGLCTRKLSVQQNEELLRNPEERGKDDCTRDWTNLSSRGGLLMITNGILCYRRSCKQHSHKDKADDISCGRQNKLAYKYHYRLINLLATSFHFLIDSRTLLVILRGTSIHCMLHASPLWKGWTFLFQTHRHVLWAKHSAEDCLEETIKLNCLNINSYTTGRLKWKVSKATLLLCHRLILHG